MDCLSLICFVLRTVSVRSRDHPMYRRIFFRDITPALISAPGMESSVPGKMQVVHFPPSKSTSATSLLSGDLAGIGVSPRIAAISVEKSVEFSLEEVAKVTNNFNLSFKIGQGGFGAVYYAEFRGETEREAYEVVIEKTKILVTSFYIVHRVNAIGGQDLRGCSLLSLAIPSIMLKYLDLDFSLCLKRHWYKILPPSKA